MLKIPQLTIGLTIVAQAGTTGFDRFGQHIADDGDHCGDARGRDPACVAQGRNGRTVQHLADIDIAQPCHDPLIKKRGFDWAALTLERRDQVIGMKGVAQRFGADPLDQPMIIDRIGGA